MSALTLFAFSYVVWIPGPVVAAGDGLSPLAVFKEEFPFAGVAVGYIKQKKNIKSSSQNAGSEGLVRSVIAAGCGYAMKSVAMCDTGPLRRI